MKESVIIEIGGERPRTTIKVVGRERPMSTDYWDGNWLIVVINFIGRYFEGSYDSTILAQDFEAFLGLVDKFLAGTEGSIEFEPTDGRISLTLSTRTLGGAHVSCTWGSLDGLLESASAEWDLGYEDLVRLKTGLSAVLSTFPIVGHEGMDFV
jgi:hypothetical protein